MQPIIDLIRGIIDDGRVRAAFVALLLAIVAVVAKLLGVSIG